MVFGPRVVEAIGRGVAGPSPTGAMRAVVEGGLGDDVIGGRSVSLPEVPGVEPALGTATELRDRLQRAMTRGAGVLRDARSLHETGEVLAATVAAVDALPREPEREELRNLVTVGWALLRAAEVREESRGCHTREDFPDRDPAFQLRLVLR
jgi:L-aspartate oxidase